MTPPTRPTRGRPPAVVPCAFCSTPNRVDLTKLSTGPKCAKCRRPILLDRPLKVTDGDFERTLQGTDRPGAGGLLRRLVRPLPHDGARRSTTSPGGSWARSLVLKLDTDANPAIAGRFGIRGIPTVIAFDRGKERGRHVGVADLKCWRRWPGVAA